MESNSDRIAPQDGTQKIPPSIPIVETNTTDSNPPARSLSSAGLSDAENTTMMMIVEEEDPLGLLSNPQQTSIHESSTPSPQITSLPSQQDSTVPNDGNPSTIPVDSTPQTNISTNDDENNTPSSTNAAYLGIGATDLESNRFVLELEFVQCLANPAYLQFLAQERFFEDEAFVQYLKYLKYWQQPKYARYIQFPYCLEILDLLQHESFRNACSSADTVSFLHRKQYLHWEAYRSKHGKASDSESQADQVMTSSLDTKMDSKIVQNEVADMQR